MQLDSLVVNPDFSIRQLDLQDAFFISGFAYNADFFIWVDNHAVAEVERVGTRLSRSWGGWSFLFQDFRVAGSSPGMNTIRVGAIVL